MPAPSTEELDKLAKVASRVYNYIAYDLGGRMSNSAIIECCFDADRPLTCAAPSASESAKKEHEFCKQMFAKYGFSAVVRAVSRKVRFA